MKQFFFGIAITLSSFSACAQGNNHNLILNIGELTEVNIMEDQFSAIESNTIPIAVKNVISESYPTATITNAYLNKAEQYKLEIILKDGRSGFLYADRDGNWIER